MATLLERTPWVKALAARVRTFQRFQNCVSTTQRNQADMASRWNAYCLSAPYTRPLVDTRSGTTRPVGPSVAPSEARTLKGGETVLDYGCGSGILAIVAARLGARDVVGIDIDPQAVLAAPDNAAKNGVAARFFTPDATPDQTAEIVVANILANPLVVLAPLITGRCSHTVALSGILEAQAEEVIAAYAPYFRLAVTDREDGWVLITGVRQ